MQQKSVKLLEEYYIPEKDPEAKNRARIIKNTIDGFISSKDKKIIDIGLGGGELLGKFLADTNIKNLYGLDISDYQFENCIRKFNFIKNNLIVGDATSLDTFKNQIFNDKFDIVICTDVIEHVFDPIALVDNLVSITRNSGYIIFNIPLELNLKARLTYLFGTPIHDPFCVGGHIRFFKPDHVLNYFGKRNDLKVIGKDFDMRFGKESFVRRFKHSLANIHPGFFAGRITIALQKK